MKRKRPPERHDFRELGKKYKEFGQYVFTNKFGKPTIDWKNPAAVRELNKAILHHDYGITLELPEDQLCPTVTLRANYIYWLQELMATRESKQEGKQESEATNLRIRGVDIGTGASCIYPLLGHSIAGWDFLATDIDEVSLQWAQHNVQLNHWEEFITLRQANPDQILYGVLKEGESFDFCMCNPPFFSDMEQTGQNPKVVCPATKNELVTEGGEVAFVGQMIRDSLKMKDQIRWYTSMLGRKVSMKPLLATLREYGIVNIRTTEFHQGRNTRWAIGWSFSDEGLIEMQQRVAPSVMKMKTAASFKTSTHPAEVIKKLSNLFAMHGIKFAADTATYFIKAFHETWKESDVSTEKEDQSKEPKDPLFSFEVQVLQSQPKVYLCDFKFKGGNKEAFYKFMEVVKPVFMSFLQLQLTAKCKQLWDQFGVDPLVSYKYLFATNNIRPFTSPKF